VPTIEQVRQLLEQGLDYSEIAVPEQSEPHQVYMRYQSSKKVLAMKFAVIGATGLIGSRVVDNLNAAGHQALPRSLSTGVDIITGQGPGGSRGGRRRRRQPDQFPDLR
jgi:hypothetical protein